MVYGLSMEGIWYNHLHGLWYDLWYDPLSATESMERSIVWSMTMIYVQIMNYSMIWQLSKIEVPESTILKNEILNGLFGTEKCPSTGAQCSN